MSFEFACLKSQVPAGSARRAELGGREVSVVADDNGEIHAIDDICTHGEVSLSEGEVDGCSIECWLHGSTFDLVTGKPETPPAFEPVDVFAVRVDGDEIHVDTSTILNSSAK